MNRSNTALSNLFDKKYLEPEVYGSKKKEFMEGSRPATTAGDDDSKASRDLSQDDEPKVGCISPLKRPDDPGMLSHNAEENKIIMHLIEQKRNRKAVEHRIREQK